MRKPPKIETEQKIREGLMIDAAIDNAGMMKKELAQMIGYDDKAISQWFHKTKPTAIPDWAFIKMCEILKLDPSHTRPWIYELYLSLDKIFKGKSNSISTADILSTILDSLPSDDRAELIRRYISGLGHQ